MFEHLKQQVHKVGKKIDFTQFIGKKCKRNQSTKSKTKQLEQQEVYQEQRIKEISKFQVNYFGLGLSAVAYVVLVLIVELKIK